jgi:hypothetical protein
MLFPLCGKILCRKVTLENLIVAQLINKFFSIYDSPTFIMVSMTAYRKRNGHEHQHSEVAIDEPAQPFDSRDISNTVYSACAFRVAEASSSGASSCSVF